MPDVLTPTKSEAPVGAEDIGQGGFGPGGDGFGGGGSWESPGWSAPSRAYRTGMWMALAAITMLFAAFTSALVVRKGLSNDWVPTALPRILYLNTLVLFSSSLTLEISRRALNRGWGARFERWLYGTAGLGVAFVAGQFVAWRELAARGVYLATNPSSSFFYLLTAAHGVHLFGGIVALSYLASKARTIAFEGRKPAAVEVTALYWHFMDGLWIYILLLFIVRV